MPAPGKQSRGGWRGRPARGGPRWLFHPVRHPSHTSAITHPARNDAPHLYPLLPPFKRAAKFPSGGVEPPRRLNLPASAFNPTLHRAPFPLSFSLLPLHFNRQHLSRPPSVASQSTRRRRRRKTTKKDEIIPLLLPHRRRRRRRRRGRATPRITSPASSLVLPLCGLLRALARTATGHCDYAA